MSCLVPRLSGTNFIPSRLHEPSGNDPSTPESTDDLDPFAESLAGPQATSTPPASDGARGVVPRSSLSSDLIPSPPLHTPSLSLPSPPPSPTRDVAAELRDVVDKVLHQKRTAWQALQDENASLRAQLALLQTALTQATSAPGSETGAVLAALERERARRANAEESRAATERYLTEQVEAAAGQKRALEAALRGFTDGREFWKAKAIAALERCEALEEENVRVKRELGAFVRKQVVVVERQIGDILHEVAEERERLRRLEEEEPLLVKYSQTMLVGSKSSQAEVSICPSHGVGVTLMLDHRSTSFSPHLRSHHRSDLSLPEWLLDSCTTLPRYWFTCRRAGRHERARTYVNTHGLPRTRPNHLY